MSKLILLLIAVYPCIVLANLDQITWRGTYYQGIPIKKGISKQFCIDHTPGTFIHTVKSALTNSIITDKNIKLFHPSFKVEKVDNVYLIYGHYHAQGKSSKIIWEDLIHYYLYKFSEAGITKGIWYTNECKGLYEGIAIKDNQLDTIRIKI